MHMKAKSTEAAISIYEKMQEVDIKPDLPVYYQLADIYQMRSQPDKMLDVYGIHASLNFEITIDFERYCFSREFEA